MSFTRPVRDVALIAVISKFCLIAAPQDIPSEVAEQHFSHGNPIFFINQAAAWNKLRLIIASITGSSASASPV
jgi:hypothetical protein